MRVIILVILAITFIGCNPLKHYQKVQEDPYRNEAERLLLAKACLEEFPKVPDTIRMVDRVLDTAAYESYRRNYQELLERYIETQSRDTTGGTTTQIKEIVYRCTSADSARIVRAFLKTYNPPPIIKKERYEVIVPDLARQEIDRQKIKQCDEESSKQAKEIESLQKKARQGVIFKWILIGVGVLLALLVVGYVMGRIKLPVVNR